MSGTKTSAHAVGNIKIIARQRIYAPLFFVHRQCCTQIWGVATGQHSDVESANVPPPGARASLSRSAHGWLPPADKRIGGHLMGRLFVHLRPGEETRRACLHAPTKCAALRTGVADRLALLEGELDLRLARQWVDARAAVPRQTIESALRHANATLWQ